MPSKKKKYNARFPPARIKKIMQSDEEVGKVAQAVPVIISRALELFVESLLKKAEVVTQQRNAKTLTPSHLKQCIMSEQRFDFLRDLVSTISDIHDEDSPEGTPRATTSSEPAFVFQAPPPGSSSSSSSTSMAGPSASTSSSTPSATSTSSDFYQNPPQNPSNSSEMSEFMMSLPNYLNVKHEDNNKSNQHEQAYSIQQHPHHHHQQQQQQSVPHYQPSYQHHQQQQQQHHPHSSSTSSSSNPPGYIPSSSQQQQQHQDHINSSYSHYYSQYEHSANGKLKLETHNNPMSHANYPHQQSSSSSSSSTSVGAHRSSYPAEQQQQHHGSYEHYYDKQPNEGYLSEPRHHNY